MNGTIIVAGASGAFGSTIVHRLVRAGHRVLALARTRAGLDELGDDVETLAADITSDDCIDGLRSHARGPVLAIVNSVGVPVAGRIAEAPATAIIDAVDIKVNGMLRMIRALDDRLEAGSRLISIGGHYGLEPTHMAATAGLANAAVLNMCRQLAAEYGPRGITAHVIAPGPADTPRLRRVVGARAEARGSDVDTVLTEMRDRSVLGAFTTPEQVAWAVEMLLAPEASALTGSALMLDSGRRHGIG